MTQQNQQARKPRTTRSPETDVEEKRPRGRPAKAPEEKLEQRSLRLYPSMWQKIDLYGLDWLREVIKRAKPPKQ